MTLPAQTARPDERLPRYQQIRDDLARRIAQSEWQPEQALPTEPELTAAYAVSIGTLRKAMDLLVAEGWLERSQGRGTYVRRPRFDNSLFRFFRFWGRDGDSLRPDSRVISSQRYRTDPTAKDGLQLRDDAESLLLKRHRLVNQRTVLVEDIWLPLPAFEALATLAVEDFDDLLYPMYERRCQQVVASATEILRVEQANAELAQALDIAAGSPVITVQRTALDFAGKPLEWRKTVGSASSFEYRIDIR